MQLSRSVRCDSTCNARRCENHQNRMPGKPTGRGGFSKAAARRGAARSGSNTHAPVCIWQCVATRGIMTHRIAAAITRTFANRSPCSPSFPRGSDPTDVSIERKFRISTGESFRENDARTIQLLCKHPLKGRNAGFSVGYIRRRGRR